MAKEARRGRPKGKPARPAGAAPDPAPADSDFASILLVDDQPARLSALEAALSDMGEDVRLVKATSGKEALRHLLKQEFAVILLDVHMPVMDGFETASLVRQRRRSEQTPIIFITAFGPNEAQVTRGYSLGAVDYIFAPVLAEVLKAKVTVFLELHRKTAQVRRQADWLRAEAERRADALETRLRVLLEGIEVGVFRATPEGRVLEANRAFRELLGLAAPADAERFDASILLPPAEPGPDPAAIRSRDLRHACADGQVRWLAVSATASRGPSGEPVVDGILEDVTARRSAEEALRAAHAALETQAGNLERSNADLQRFAHVISHDLQEPLRMVSTFTEVLERRYGGQLDAEARQFLTCARDGAERMQGMIHGLLDFCLLDKTSGRVAPADCNELLDRALGNLAVAVQESGATVSRDSLPVVQGDDLLLANVFQNLVGNAVKFRRDGVPPRVHVGAERRNGEWVLSVADNGIGIPSDDEDRLFMVFHRLPGSERFPGSGVGLAICKRIVERHGGRIWREAAGSGGSVFRFTLPASTTVARPGPKGSGRKKERSR